MQLAVAWWVASCLLVAGAPPALAQSNYTPYTVSTLAGKAKATGSADGTGSAARFFFPSGVAVDSAGNIYVADTKLNRIRKVTGAGVVTTLAGEMLGSADGAGSAAQFNTPFDVAVDASGTIYVADKGNYTIRRVTPEGVVTTLAGLAGHSGSVDGTASAARFRSPSGVAVDDAGNVYVADSSDSTIRQVTPDGVVTTLAGKAGSDGSTDGVGDEARFNGPTGVAVDGLGNIYVADYYNSTIRKVAVDGTVTTLAGQAGSDGSTDGPASTARFNRPTNVAVDQVGNVYVADTLNQMIRRVTPAGVVTTLAGRGAGVIGSEDGTGRLAGFASPTDVAVDSAGKIYVADYYNSTIRKGSPALILSP
ncbi:MAG: NHL repeat-containing protein, partial [Verrucomicrobiales bacterium]